MSLLPKKIQDKGTYSAAWNRSVDRERSTTPRYGIGVLTSYSVNGVFRRSPPKFNRSTIQGMVFRGEYDPDTDTYSKNDVVRVSPGNAYATTDESGDSNPDGVSVPGVYICVKNNPDKDTNFPRNPLQDDGEDEFWDWLSTWPSAIKVCNGDTGAIEDWFIDGQKKPSITTMDDPTITMDRPGVKMG